MHLVFMIHIGNMQSQQANELCRIIQIGCDALVSTLANLMHWE